MKDEILGERYQVEQLLGKKAGRRTFLAQDLQSNQLVVIKLLTFSNDFEWDDLKLFEREAETLKSLNHPAIPRYLDYFEVSSDTVKGIALVQNYIEAKTLEQYLKAGRTFTESEVKEIATELLEILVYLHSQNPPVIHRDIKPSNILLSDRSGNSVGKVYLVDFGSVQTAAASEGGTMTVVGTYGYMAPEQFGGRAAPASDIYSLGATLIYLVTGSHPADLPQVDLKIEFEDKTNVSKEFVEWLKLMTLPSLNRRSGSAIGSLGKLNQLTKQNQIRNVEHSIESDTILHNYKNCYLNFYPSNKVDNGEISAAKRPYGSRTLMTKKSNYLEIYLPVQQFNFKLLVALITLFIPAVIFLAFLYLNLIYAPYTDYLPVFLCCIMAIISTLFALFFLLLAFTNIIVAIDSRRISITKKFIGFKYQTLYSQRNHIQKIVYKVPRTFQTQQVIIWAGIRKFIIVNGNSSLSQILSEPEVEWIAHELSEFLGIPISRE